MITATGACFRCGYDPCTCDPWKLGEPRQHCATFSDPILGELQRILPNLLRPGTIYGAPVILDPFAGTGKIHRLGQLGYDTLGVELEPEWAGHHERTMVGDSRNLADELARRGIGPVDGIVTSPCYGNRMADTYAGENVCPACKGTGVADLAAGDPPGTCERCEGTGEVEPTTRYTYTISLGHPLTAGNAGGVQWGREYRQLHRAVYRSCVSVLKPGGWVVVNMSDHLRNKETVPVTMWHATALVEAGLTYHKAIPVRTKRSKNGANRDARAPEEWLLIARKAGDRHAA